MNELNNDIRTDWCGTCKITIYIFPAKWLPVSLTSFNTIDERKTFVSCDLFLARRSSTSLKVIINHASSVLLDLLNQFRWRLSSLIHSRCYSSRIVTEWIQRIDLRGYIILSHCSIRPHSNVNLVSDLPYHTCTCTRYFTIITVLYDVRYCCISWHRSRSSDWPVLFSKLLIESIMASFDIQCLFTIAIVVNDNYYDPPIWYEFRIYYRIYY